MSPARTPRQTPEPEPEPAGDAISSEQVAKPSAMVSLERRIGYALTAFAAGLGAVSIAAGPNAVVGGIGLVTAAGLGLAVWRGHRVITMFAALLAGLLVGSVPIQLLFIGYSGFLMLRLNKAQAKRNASRPRLTPQQRREAKEAKMAARRQGAAPDGPPGPASRQPAPNRRYTPPKAKPGSKKR